MLAGLADKKGKARIVARIEAARHGAFGDCDAVGDGVAEMRIDFGPGYRTYFMREGSVVFLLLCGGDKSTQNADIKRARKMAKQLREAAKAETSAVRARSGKGEPNAKSKPHAKLAKTKKG